MKIIFRERSNTLDIFQNNVYLEFDFYSKTLHAHEQTRSMFEVRITVT